MSAVGVAHTRHGLRCDTADNVCCATQHDTGSGLTRQTCLLCDTADMPHLLATQNHGLASRQGRGKPPMPTTQLSAMPHTRFTLRKTLVLPRRPGGASPSPPATQNHGFVLQIKIWSKIEYLLIIYPECRHLPFARRSELDRPEL